MMLWDTILDAVLLLSAATLLGLVFTRLHQSAIIGYMAAGVVLGPGVLDVVRGSPALTGMAELGVILLLFTVGLEFPWKRLRTMGATALGGGTLQLALTSAAGIAVFLLLRFPTREALVLGMMIAPSTTALLLRLFTERSEMDSIHARNAAVISVLQSMYDVPLLILITALGTATTVGRVFLGLGKAAGFAAVLFAVLYVAGYLLIPRLLRITALSKNRELPILLAMLTCLGSAWGAHALHISPALGAFVAGALLAESPFATQVRADTNPIKTVFATLFFASFGLLVDVRWAAAHPFAVITCAAGILAGKALIVWPIMRFFRSSHAHAIATGICLGPLDEFAFVIAGIGLTMGVLSQDTFQLIVSAALVTLFAAPLLITGAERAGHIVEAGLVRLRLVRSEGPAPAAAKGLKGHVIVVGFGPAGQGVVQALSKSDVHVVVTELNPSTAERAVENGIRCEVGDATRSEVLEHVGIASAAAIVITVPDFRTVRRMIRQVRALAPETAIVARARHHMRADELEAAGAYAVVDEEVEVGHALGKEVLKHLPQPPRPEARVEPGKDVHKQATTATGEAAAAPVPPTPRGGTTPDDARKT